MQIDRSTFDRWLGEAYDSLPDEYRDKLIEHNVTVQAADEPVQDTSGEDAVTLGQFIGVPLPQQQRKYAATTPRILIYQQSFELIFDSRDQIRDQIKRTLLHEVGHFLGKDEQELHELEERLYGPERS